MYGIYMCSNPAEIFEGVAMGDEAGGIEFMTLML